MKGKKMKRIALLGLLGLALVLGCISRADAWDPKLKSVSLLRLIANPDKYDGQMVRTYGYLRIEFEGNSIYLHKEDYEHSLLKNGLWVSFNPDKVSNQAEFSNKYVLIEGRFDAHSQGHMGLWSGTIKDIWRLDEWGDQDEDE